MITTIKYILKNIPKWVRWVILGILVSPILGYIVLQVFINKPIEFSLQNLLYILALILMLTVIGYVIGSYRSVKQLLSKPPALSPTKEKKELPYQYLTIGQYKTENICSDIRASIKLSEKVKPNVDVFLDRVFEGEPYCPKCFRPMDKWNAGWQADFAQIGYFCEKCNIKHKGNWEDVRNDIKGIVRKDYDRYWDNYRKQLSELTDNKPENYKLY